jgi:hypothetical protein
VGDRMKVLVGRMESFFPAPSAKTKIWPVGYVPASFRVPNGLLVADCFRLWPPFYVRQSHFDHI